MVDVKIRNVETDVWTRRILALTKLILALGTLAGIILAGFK